ncbi:MAG TPA: Hsp20/alpha crystallin family protein [Polyangiaceae bacterium]
MSLIRYQSPELTAWPSFDRWANLRDEMNSLFEVPFLAAGGRQQLFNGWTPALDVYQNADNVVAVIELPGMRKEDIDISLHDGTLTIAGERKSESEQNEDNAERTERFVGKFRRSITLPTRVDAGKVAASYKDGVLTVTLPKAEEAKPKKIEVSIE